MKCTTPFVATCAMQHCRTIASSSSHQMHLANDADQLEKQIYCCAVFFTPIFVLTLALFVCLRRQLRVSLFFWFHFSLKQFQRDFVFLVLIVFHTPTDSIQIDVRAKASIVNNVVCLILVMNMPAGRMVISNGTTTTNAC